MLIDLCARYHIWRGSKLSEVMTKKCPIMNTQYSGSADWEQIDVPNGRGNSLCWSLTWHLADGLIYSGLSKFFYMRQTCNVTRTLPYLHLVGVLLLYLKSML